MFPVLDDDSIQISSSTVNIAGTDEKMSGLGRRATLSVEFADFPYHDRLTDKYVAERKSGTAQTDEGGYDPATRGTFFTKLRSRWPHYGGRAIRYISGYVENGALVDTITRNYVITDWIGPKSTGSGAGIVRIEAEDIFNLAGDDKAVAPKVSKGSLIADIDDTTSPFTLQPVGIGSEYPASGFATIGSEIIEYTRSGDVITPVTRGARNTDARTHSAGDTFQEALRFDQVRIDDAIYTLLTEYTNVPASFCPKTTDWAPEIDVWLPDALLDTLIVKPTGVASLISEICLLGVSVWFDDINQEIQLLANHPPLLSSVLTFSDEADILMFDQEDRDEDRLTQIIFYSAQYDETKSATDPSNYGRASVRFGDGHYDDDRIKEVFCRWLGAGADALISVVTARLLTRFERSPKRFTLVLDAKDREIKLAQIIYISSKYLTDVTGNPVSTLAQVISRKDSVPGHEIQVQCQLFDFSGRYGYIMENTATSDYDSATDLEKAEGAYIIDDGDLFFSDGTEPYVFI